MSRRERRTFTKVFKQQMVDLYLAEKLRAERIREYDLTASAFDKWMRQAQTTGSFSEKEKVTPEQKELKELWKRHAQLEMENDSLKQAALIFGRKDKSLSERKRNTPSQRCVSF